MNQLRAKIDQLLGGRLNLKLVAFTLVLAVGIVAVLTALNSPKPYRISNFAQTSSGQAGQSSQDTNFGAGADSSGVAGSVAVAKLFVHVVGLVVNPGIYELDSGSRLYEAIFAAGGFTKGADQSSVNLARPLTDGEQVVVTSVGAASVIAGSSGIGKPALISLNRASQTELESLPRVGTAMASRIIDYRTTNGGFKSVRDLLKVTGIGQKMFADIAKLVTL